MLAHGENLPFRFFLLCLLLFCLCSKNSNATKNSVCVAWLESDKMSAMSTCFLTFFALVFIEIMYYQPAFIDADEQVIWNLEQNCFEIEPLFEWTVALAFPWQHTIKSRQNQCLCKRVKWLFSHFWYIIGSKLQTITNQI